MRRNRAHLIPSAPELLPSQLWSGYPIRQRRQVRIRFLAGGSSIEIMCTFVADGNWSMAGRNVVWSILCASILLGLDAFRNHAHAGIPVRSYNTPAASGELLPAGSSIPFAPDAAPDTSGGQFLYAPFVAHLHASSGVTSITLAGDSIFALGSGVTVTERNASITAGGTYTISGVLNDGQVVVDNQDGETVMLVLDGVDIRSTGAAINVVSAKQVIVYLPSGKENFIAGGAVAVPSSSPGDEPNATLFSRSDLTISGTGALSVTADWNDGIASKDELVLAGGTIAVSARDDGIRGNDSLVIRSGTIAVAAGGDGLKSGNEGTGVGHIVVNDGDIAVTAVGDAFQAHSQVTIRGGKFLLTTGGGSSATLAPGVSAKAIKSDLTILLDGGAFTIDAADDAIHADGNVVVNGGDYIIASGDDGVRGNASISINGGDIHIVQSYEGLESRDITINEGNIHIVARDDGVNVSSGAGGIEGPAVGRAGSGQGSGDNTDPYWLRIHGGNLVIDSGGDGIDANAQVEMTGGAVIIHAPPQSADSGLDYDGAFNVSGGWMVAAGSRSTAQAPSSSSAQNSLSIVFLAHWQPAGTLVHIQDSAGNPVLTFAPAKEYDSLVFSSPQLVQGSSYRLYIGGSASGESVYGVFTGTYTPGQQRADFTISKVITTIRLSPIP
jgi:hypothetical protein